MPKKKLGLTKKEYEQKAYNWGCRERLKKRPLHLNPFTKGYGEYEAFHRGRRGLPLSVHSGVLTMAKKEPAGVVIKADRTGPLHAELKSRSGMPQAFQVRFGGKRVKLRGIGVKTLVDPRPYGTLVLDFLPVKRKKAKGVHPLGEVDIYESDLPKKAKPKAKVKAAKPKKASRKDMPIRAKGWRSGKLVQTKPKPKKAKK